MSKKNITYILAAESLIHALTSIITGIMMGTFLNKLMLLILYKIINQPPVNGLFFSVEALKSTLVLFVILFAVSLIYNVASIRVGKPIALLQSDRTGEKEPKVKVPIFILGIITLTVGYSWHCLLSRSGCGQHIICQHSACCDRNLLSFYSRKYFYPEVHEKESEVLL